MIEYAQIGRYLFRPELVQLGPVGSVASGQIFDSPQVKLHHSHLVVCVCAGVYAYVCAFVCVCVTGMQRCDDDLTENKTIDQP